MGATIDRDALGAADRLIERVVARFQILIVPLLDAVAKMEGWTGLLGAECKIHEAQHQ
jgi:hypothetical protein